MFTWPFLKGFSALSSKLPCQCQNALCFWPSLLWCFDDVFNLSFFLVGPLLSESLDVRAIPIKKCRQLTMALSGNIDVNDLTPLLDSLLAGLITKRHKYVNTLEN